MFQTQQNKTCKCVYCQADNHKPSECGKITSPAECKEFLARDFVSIEQDFTNSRNAKVPQHVKTVVNDITHQSVAHQRK